MGDDEAEYTIGCMGHGAVFMPEGKADHFTGEKGRNTVLWAARVVLADPAHGAHRQRVAHGVGPLISFATEHWTCRLHVMKKEADQDWSQAECTGFISANDGALVLTSTTKRFDVNSGPYGVVIVELYSDRNGPFAVDLRDERGQNIKLTKEAFKSIFKELEAS